MNRQDVLIKADERGLYDLVIENNDIDSAYGFESALPTSYFTDSRASTVQVQEASRRRGWVGNILYLDLTRELGGLLWLLDQSRITDDTINFAQGYAYDSLQWMIEDGLARSIIVTVERYDERKIMIYTDITSVNNTVQRYITLWRNTDLTRSIPL